MSYPVAPLLELVDRVVPTRRLATDPRHVGDPGESRGLESLYGKPIATAFYRARRVGELSDAQADRLAVAFGRHPCELWPTWFQDAACQWCEECCAERDAARMAAAIADGEATYERLAAMSATERDAWCGASEQAFPAVDCGAKK